MKSRLGIELPRWLAATLAARQPPRRSAEERMRFVVDLAARNVALRTGGPFAAAVFDHPSGRLLAAAVNRVEHACASLAHAEMLALALAQQAEASYDLGRDGAIRELCTSVEPCAMCLGAIPWSGVRRLVCGARGADAESIGFDEGDKPRGWAAGLRGRGIAVTRDVCRSSAIAVLQSYSARGGARYNGRGVEPRR
jgi:tRNA(Arg) A34 adenosine deaminase TadA